MSSLVYGWGVNDAPYAVSVKKKIPGTRSYKREFDCPYYKCWAEMVRRCYSQKSLKNFPSYAGSECCEEWRSFMSFRSWMESNEWQGKELDKDIMGDGRIYSPSTCCFVSKEINLFLTNCKPSDSEILIGVSKSPSNRFRAQIRINGTKKTLGQFETAIEAHVAWCRAKINAAIDLISEYKLDQRISKALISRLSKNLELAIEKMNAENAK